MQLHQRKNNFSEKLRYWISEKIAPKISVPNFVHRHSYNKLGLADMQGNIEEMFKAFRSLTFACIDKRAKEVAKAGNSGKFVPYIKKNNGELKQLDRLHPLVLLLENPNPYYSLYNFWYITQTNKDISGNAYWWVARDQLDIPRELWLIPSNLVQLVHGNLMNGEPLIKEYIINWGQGNRTTVAEKDIIHLKLPDPHDPYSYGASLLMKAATEIDIDYYVSEHQREFFKNDAIPSAIILFKNNLSKDARKAFEENWQEKYRMKPGKIGYLEGEATLETLQGKKELDFINSIDPIRKKIQAVFGVPDSKLMLEENITARATLETLDYNFLKETIDTELESYDGQLTKDLAKLFDENIIIKHDSVIQKDIMREAELDSKRLTSGIVSINEIRERNGLIPIKGGNEPLVSYSLVPLSTISTTARITEETPKHFELKSYDEKQKEYFWKEFEIERIKEEHRIERKLIPFFNEIKNNILSGDKKFASDKKDVLSAEDFLFNIVDWMKDLGLILNTETTRAIENGFNLFKKRYEVSGIVFSPKMEEVQEGVANIVGKTESIMGTLHKELEEQLNEGIRLNETTAQLSERVKKFFDNTNDYRSQRIARTTSTFAINKGQQIGAIKSKVFDKKIWLTQRDARVRDSHFEIDGEEIKLKEKFLVIDSNTGHSGKLDIPGDPTAPKEFTINCRCSVLYII